MPINPILPAMIDGQGPANLTETGKWISRGHDELANISDILDVNVPNVEVNSIPTVWARPLLFEMALFNTHHKIHKEVLGEWEGMIALIALFEYKHLPISSMSVDLSSLKNPKNEVFFRGLHRLLPQNKLSSDTGWEQLFLILYNNKPIGVTSPTTLVATSTDYGFTGMSDTVKWFNGRRLTSPVGMLSPGEAASLSSWLGRLKTNLNNHHESKGGLVNPISVDSKNLNHLNTLLTNFQGKVGMASDYLPGTKRLGIDGPGAGLFSYLNEPVGAEENRSAVELITSDTRQPARKLLILSEEISAAFGLENTHVTVTGTKTLADLRGMGGHPDGRHHEFAGVAVEGAEVWNARELFSKKLVLIRNNENAFPGTLEQKWPHGLPKHNNMPVSVILPINRKLLEHLSPSDLNKRISFEHDKSSNEIKVSLTLTLSGVDGGSNGTDFIAQRKYSLNSTSDFEILDSLPVLEVFPNFRRKDWKANYIAFSADILDATFEVEPTNEIAEQSDLRSSKTGKRTIWRTDSYPEALICRRNGEEIGLLLLKEPENGDHFGSNKHFQVGVDFGASGTCVYAMEGDHPHCIAFKNSKLSVISKDKEKSSELFDFFLPDVDLNSPFLSLFQPLYRMVDANNVLPMLDGHVYYFEDKLAKDVVPNLKWSDDSDPRSIKYIKSFLTQICLQTTAELIRKGAQSIEWKFSYPTAFFEDQADAYKGVVWKSVIDNVNELCGVNAPDPKHYSESLASARYFRVAENAPTETGTIFIDIGSSTSDISIWQRDLPLWQTSLKYAGRDVFLNYLIEKPEILNLLLGGESTKELNDAIRERVPEDQKWAIADVVLRKNTQQLFKTVLGEHLNNTEIKKFRSYLAFGLGGLFFYLGLAVRSLVQSGTYRNNQENEVEMPIVHAGGNGALMFRWLTNGSDIEGNRAITGFFADVFSDGLNTPFPVRTGIEGFAPVGEDEPLFGRPTGELIENYNTRILGDFRLKLSKMPKHEASFGLVNTGTNNGVDTSAREVIAGEVFLLDGSKKNWETRLDNTIFDRDISLPGKLENLARYIDSYGKAISRVNTIEGILVEDALLTEARRRMANTFGDLRQEKPEKRIVEPIFVIALKHLMKIIRQG